MKAALGYSSADLEDSQIEGIYDSYPIYDQRSM